MPSCGSSASSAHPRSRPGRTPSTNRPRPPLQTRTLTVHTLITEGAVEDGIDQLHAGKRNLAGAELGTTTSLGTALVRLVARATLVPLTYLAGGVQRVRNSYPTA